MTISPDTTDSKPRRGFRLRLPVAAVAAVVAGLGVLTGCDAQENANLDKGEALFTQQCGSCHALKAASTNAEIGPNLDAAFTQARADGMDNDTIEGVVQYQIAHPRPAEPDQVSVYMPPNLLTGQDAEDVATYVASVAGDPNVEGPQFIPPEFFATNCGSCHTLAAAGTTATIGPSLDDVLPGQSAAMISNSIVDPGANVTPGFPAGMPANFGDALTPDQLGQLVAYLQQSVRGGK